MWDADVKVVRTGGVETEDTGRTTTRELLIIFEIQRERRRSPARQQLRPGREKTIAEHEMSVKHVRSDRGSFAVNQVYVCLV